jgi:hypothetical protein
MNNYDQKIFEPSSKRWNACLQNYMGFYQLANYYLESANTLIDRTIDDSSKLDVCVYSAVFLYRHSIELLLKELIWMSNYLLGKGKTFPKHHRLMNLWQILKSNAISLLTSDFPLNEEEVRYIETTPEEVMKHDPESDGFRYPFDKKMQRTYFDINYVDVKALYERFNQIHEYFGRISYMIDHLYEE